jgi:hypothetical protein
MCHEPILLNQSSGFVGHISYTPHLQALNTAMIYRERNRLSKRGRNEKSEKVQTGEGEEEAKFAEKGWWRACADVEKLRFEASLDYANKKTKKRKEKKEKEHIENSSEEKPHTSEIEKPLAIVNVSEENNTSVEESSSGVGPSTSGMDEIDGIHPHFEEVGEEKGHAFHHFENSSLNIF